MNEKKILKINVFHLFPNTFWKMKSVSSMVFFKLFTKTTCENRLYYSEFGSSRLQKRLEYGGNVKNSLFLIIFQSEKNKDFDLTIDKVFANLLTTPYIYLTLKKLHSYHMFCLLTIMLNVMPKIAKNRIRRCLKL